MFHSKYLCSIPLFCFRQKNERMRMMKMNEKVKKMAFSMAGALVAALVLCAVIIPTAYRSYASSMKSFRDYAFV